MCRYLNALRNSLLFQSIAKWCHCFEGSKPGGIELRIVCVWSSFPVFGLGALGSLARMSGDDPTGQRSVAQGKYVAIIGHEWTQYPDLLLDFYWVTHISTILFSQWKRLSVWEMLRSLFLLKICLFSITQNNIITELYTFYKLHISIISGYGFRIKCSIIYRKFLWWLGPFLLGTVLWIIPELDQSGLQIPINGLC